MGHVRFTHSWLTSVATNCAVPDRAGRWRGWRSVVTRTHARRLTLAAGARAHGPGNAFAAGHHALIGQLCTDAGHAVGGITGLVSGSDGLNW